MEVFIKEPTNMMQEMEKEYKLTIVKSLKVFSKMTKNIMESNQKVVKFTLDIFKIICRMEKAKSQNMTLFSKDCGKKGNNLLKESWLTKMEKFMLVKSIKAFRSTDMGYYLKKIWGTRPSLKMIKCLELEKSLIQTETFILEI
jgi:hypothetical protein